MVIKSYYPFHQLYLDVLVKIYEEIRSEKIQIYISNQKKIDKKHKYELIDGNAELQILKNKLKPQLDKLINQVKIPQNFKKVQFSFMEQLFYYQVPEISMLSFIDGEFCCKNFLGALSFDNFLFIFLSIFHERSLIFVSEDMKLISSSM